jgi:hypothetical protein
MEESPERILCAAIWYDFYDEKLPNITYQNSELDNKLGIIVTGLRHNNCMDTFTCLANKLRPDLSLEEYYQISSYNKYQGFLTTYNRYVDRFEAYLIAKEQNQIINTIGTIKNKLLSENLY